MSGVRPFVKCTDLHKVAELHRLVFGRAAASSRTYLQRHEKGFCDVFFNNPWHDPALPSLVYEGDDEQIVGFLGIIPRPMVVKGEPLQVALAAQFMVHPNRRGQVGLQLARAFFAGPQDLSLCEGNELARTVWEGLGGTTLLLYSIRWTRPLRPSRYVLAFLRRHGTASVVASALTPVAVAVDRLLWQSDRSPALANRTTTDELTEDTLLRGLAEVTRGRSLRPTYDRQSLKWLLARLADRTDRGQFRKMLVRNAARQPIGWYMYYLNPEGASEVVQVASMNGEMQDVLNQLFQDAYAHGAVALTGQLDPAAISEFSAARCLFHGSGGSWILAHAKRPERLDALQRGDAFLTRLEGETWVGF